jgi:hypothetical protein
VRGQGARPADRTAAARFTAETFILSFPLPNFHFHAVTAYDILRSRGVPIGKRLRGATADAMRPGTLGVDNDRPFLASQAFAIVGLARARQAETRWKSVLDRRSPRV